MGERRVTLSSARRLFVLKLTHTVIWLLFALLICYIPMAAVADSINWFTYVAIAVIFGEALVLFLFSWRCPLTVLGKRYTKEHEEGFDIFLPSVVARWNKAIFTTIFVVGLLLVLFRILR